MRFALVLFILTLAALTVALLVGFFRGLPLDESAPTPRPEALRRVTHLGPPASLRERLKNRLRVCPYKGHAWAIAYPLPRGQRIRRCRKCGKVEEYGVVESYRTERA